MPSRPGYIYGGSPDGWVEIGQNTVSPVKYQNSAPSSPSVGDIWIDADGDIPGVDISQFLRWRKTAVGGETTLSGADDNALILSYTPNYEQLYINGVLQVRGQDYTATTGTSITGLTALAANDVVEVFSVVARVVGDVYTQAQTNSLLDAKSNVSTTGLVLITSATIGTSVSTITVSNAFSASYDAYKIVISGGTGSATNNLQLRLGSSNTNVYAYSLVYHNYASNSVAGEASSGVSEFRYAGGLTTNGLFMNVDLINPFLAKWTRFYGLPALGGDTQSGTVTGTHKVASSYTDFTIFTDAGTVTGGTIKVYGYK